MITLLVTTIFHSSTHQITNPPQHKPPNSTLTKTKRAQTSFKHSPSLIHTRHASIINPNPPLPSTPMGKSTSFDWTSALIGAAAAAAASFLLSSKPRDPTFHLISLELTSFNLSFPALDADVILTVHVTNPNAAPIQYSDTVMSIYYAGDLLGSAPVQAGSQPPRSCQLLRLPARLSGLQLAHHAKKFLADVARREMVLESTVDISGAAKVLWWNHGFKVHVDSHVVVDPVFLDVIDQENKSKLELFAES